MENPVGRDYKNLYTGNGKNTGKQIYTAGLTDAGCLGAEMPLGDFGALPCEYFLYYYRKNNLEAVRNDGFKLVFPHEGRIYTKYPPGRNRRPLGRDGRAGEVLSSTGFGKYETKYVKV